MGFHVLAKHGLNKHGLKDPNLVSFWGQPKNGNEEEEEEEEEERGAKIKQSQAPKRYGTTNLVWILGFVG